MTALDCVRDCYIPTCHDGMHGSNHSTDTQAESSLSDSSQSIRQDLGHILVRGVIWCSRLSVGHSSTMHDTSFTNHRTWRRCR